jgi:hypothetical protein
MVTPNISYNIAGLQATTRGNETRLIRRKTKEKIYDYLLLRYTRKVRTYQ